MLFDQFEKDQLLFNMNFKEAVGAYAAYRGELVVVPGEVADAQGRRKPPSSILKGAIALATGDKLTFIAGSLDLLEELELVGELYKDALTPETTGVFFIVNLDKSLVIDLNGTKVVGVPMTDGMVWTELSELVGLEKGDFKGQDAGEKVVTMYKAVLDLKPKYPQVTYAESLAFRNEAKRFSRGPV